jgi:hypothetical protein
MGFFGVLWVGRVVGAGCSWRLAVTMAIMTMVPMDTRDPDCSPLVLALQGRFGGSGRFAGAPGR